MLKNKVINRKHRMLICVVAVLAVAAGRYIHAAVAQDAAVVQSQAKTEAAQDAADSDPDGESQRRFRVDSLRGQVVWYEEALQERLGIQTVPEAKQRVLALATKDGQLIPIIEDLRGRSFRTDPRLREMEVELMVRRYEATPSVQILRVYQWKDDQKFQVDYWCDVCAIVMFEDGPCSCCQDHNRLRTRLVER